MTFLKSLSLLICIPIMGQACTSPSIEFIQLLTLEGRYREAELESERALLSCQNSSHRKTLIQQIIDYALRTNDPKLSLRIIRTWQTHASPTEQCAWKIGEAKTMLELGNPEAIHRMTPDTCDESTQHSLAYLKGLACFSQQNWRCASETFSGLAQSPLASHASEALKAIQLARDHQPRSPKVAAMWSVVVPGAGYAYARKPQTAAAAFVTNGLFISATYWAAHKDQPALAAIMGLFSMSWYFGAIRGSAQAAQRANERDMDHFMRPLTSIP